MDRITFKRRAKTKTCPAGSIFPPSLSLFFNLITLRKVERTFESNFLSRAHALKLHESAQCRRGGGFTFGLLCNARTPDLSAQRWSLKRSPEKSFLRLSKGRKRPQARFHSFHLMSEWAEGITICFNLISRGPTVDWTGRFFSRNDVKSKRANDPFHFVR